MLIPSFFYCLIIYSSLKEDTFLLRQTFSKTQLCTAAFVLIIIAALYDESLISPNKSSFRDVKTRGQGRGCVFDVQSGLKKAGDGVH